MGYYTTCFDTCDYLLDLTIYRVDSKEQKFLGSIFMVVNMILAVTNYLILMEYSYFYWICCRLIGLIGQNDLKNVKHGLTLTH